jgi:hypothetical protein
VIFKKNFLVLQEINELTISKREGEWKKREREAKINKLKLWLNIRGELATMRAIDLIS